MVNFSYQSFSRMLKFGGYVCMYVYAGMQNGEKQYHIKRRSIYCASGC